MNPRTLTHRSAVLGALLSTLAACAGSPEAVTPAPAPAGAGAATPAAEAPDVSDASAARGSRDSRVGLRAGWMDAGEAAWNLELVTHVNRPAGFFEPGNPGNFGLANTDIAFQAPRLYLGSYHGFMIYDITDPARPTLVTSFVCPGGQGDPSVWGNLLFTSVEQVNGRTDCGTTAPTETASPDRFRGVRIFDIADPAHPRLAGGVQTCRGSHTHTLVPDPADDSHVYIYVQGTSSVRPAAELAGCIGGSPQENPNTALFRIEVIEVPLARPQDARIVNAPRIFANAAGNIAGLNPGGAPSPGAQTSAQTNQCHDITVYPAIGLAGGACSGNGILLDISNPAEPARVDEVTDPHFAYWHSATFNNDASTLLFTDEWGGGGQPHCLATDRLDWGADAIFRLSDREMTLAGYYKMPAPQTELENCVAHNGSLIPVPGRDVMVQAWYQGGVSVFDFTDPAHPVEIAYFDRGPMSADTANPVGGGYWSTYWYNGRVYGSEIGRGLDVLRLTPGEHLSANEIAAAELVRQDRFNPQTQARIEWPADPVVARALIDQLERDRSVPADRIASLRAALQTAASASGSARGTAYAEAAVTAQRLASGAPAGSVAAKRLRMLDETLRGLAR